MLGITEDAFIANLTGATVKLDGNRSSGVNTYHLYDLRDTPFLDRLSGHQVKFPDIPSFG